MEAPRSAPIDRRLYETLKEFVLFERRLCLDGKREWENRTKTKVWSDDIKGKVASLWRRRVQLRAVSLVDKVVLVPG